MSRLHLAGLASLGLWMLLLLAHSWHGPDIWYHLTWGRDLVDFGRWLPEPPVLLKQPIPANGYWLFQAPVYLLYKFCGIHITSAFFAAVWVVIGGLWLHLSALWRKPAGLGLFAAFVVVMQLRFEHRPEVFSYCYLLLMTLFASRRSVAGMAAVQILWANTHGFFVLGPVVGALVYFHETQDRWRALKIFGGLLLATLVNPFGYKVWLTVFLYLKFGRALSDLNQELFMPPIWPLFGPAAVFWLAWLATLAMIVHCLARKVNVIPALIAIGGLYLGGQAVRNMPMLFLLAPLLWRGLDYEGPRRLRAFAAAAAAVLGIILSASVVSGKYHAWAGSFSTFGVKLESSSYPVRAAEFLSKAQFAGSIFADSYDGGFLEFHLPGIKIAGDSYFTDETQTRRFFHAIKDPAGLMQLNAEMRFDALLINVENLQVMNALLSTRDWVPAFADSHRALFVSRFSNPQVSGDLSQFTYYHGDDLRQWTYEFGVVSWMAIAFQLKNSGLMRKIITDLKTAEVIPAAAYNLGVKYASSNNDEEMIRLLAEMRGRAL